VSNPVVHFEVGAADDEALVAFYREIFGWGFESIPGGGYTMIDTRAGHGINGGIGKSQNGEPWAAFYVEVEDLQATLDKANSLGGTTVLPVTSFGEAVTIAMFNDLDGLLIGLVQAPAEPGAAGQRPPSAGSGEVAEWFEIMGADAARSQQFYSALFDWTIDASFPGYGVVNTGSDRGIQGGIGGGVDTHWAAVYMIVDDVDETLSRVEKLGGSSVRAPDLAALKFSARAALMGPDEVVDSMKNAGFRDPAGNAFGIFSQ
jgi:predicted enzyme related to lactoylglutathione lyase